jgi:hypothetical protein
MPNIKFLVSLPNESSLYAALEKMEAADAASILILRKRSQHEPLRNIISGLWFAILYRAVEHHTGPNKAMRKDARVGAIRKLTACLRAGNEIPDDNTNMSKMMSKRMRSGLASWSTISEEPGLLAIVNFSNPPSKKDLHDLEFRLKGDDLPHSTNCYRAVIQRILRFMHKTLRKTESLYRYLGSALRDVVGLVRGEIQPRERDVEDAAMSLLSQYPPSQEQLTGLDSSYNRYMSLEATFNKSTHPRYTVPYDSPILICVQSGDIHGARALFREGMASIYDVDPYNLGLLYVRKSIQPT